jgi:hypothetical protein
MANLSMAATILCAMALAALAGAVGTEAAVVEHTFVVCTTSFSFLYMS